MQSSNFYNLGIAPNILSVINRHKFFDPTPIQEKAIPIGLEGKDLVGIAQTGTGKTLAFGIPMIQRLAQQKGRGLVLVPTRELAIQIDEELKGFTRGLKIFSVVCVGGASMSYQIKNLR